MQIRSETTVGIFVLAAIAAFLYIITQIGVFRFDTTQYNPYIVYFKDISGITEKSDVKIAGVKVGWVSNVALIESENFNVKATIMILKEYKLKSDSYAIVRQEGILGNKYLEIIPGVSENSSLSPGCALSRPSRDNASFDEVLYKLQSISCNIEKATESLGRILTKNEENISTIISSFKEFIQEIKTENLYDSFKNINEVAQKINAGKGLLGKIVNDEETYKDIQCTAKTIRNYFDKADKLAILVDAHVESMYGLAEKFNFRDNKGFFNLRIHPSEDYFFLAGITTSQKGYIRRTDFTSKYFDNDGKEILPSEVNKPDSSYILVSRTETIQEDRDQWRYNLQVGKIFGNIAFRLGLFEGTAGVALDFELPFESDYLRWVMSFEAYDFRGRNRYFLDTRPHLKWLNKVFFSRNIYFVFGADDFISKYNKNMFFGAGLRFADDDLKYLLSCGGRLN